MRSSDRWTRNSKIGPKRVCVQHMKCGLLEIRYWCRQQDSPILYTHITLRTYPFRDFVNLAVQEVEAGIEVLFPEHALPHYPVGNLPSGLHHQLQHLVVALPGEHDLTGVQFVNSTCHRPEIYGVVILATHYCRKMDSL